MDERRRRHRCSDSDADVVASGHVWASVDAWRAPPEYDMRLSPCVSGPAGPVPVARSGATLLRRATLEQRRPVAVCPPVKSA